MSLDVQQSIAESQQAIKDWSSINAFIETFDEADIAPAQAGPLGGVPIAIKDMICTTTGHTTAASNILKNFKSPIEATVISRLKQAGAVIVGKANLDEFAMGASTEYSAFGVTKNPWDTTRVSGGSSGGSAAAVASRQVPIALGTDTGGSIRHPASFCGVVGVKPTYGRVSRFGVISYGSSLDQVGPIAQTVKDAAQLLQVIAGHDPLDATSSRQPVPDYPSFCGQAIAGMKIGVPQEFFPSDLDPEIASTVRAAINQLEQLGAELIDISLPLTEAGIPVYFLIAKAEASTNLGRYDGLRFAGSEQSSTDLLDHYIKTRGAGFGPEVKRAILMGAYALSAGYSEEWYQQASKVRSLIRQEYLEQFEQVDLIAGPTTPEVAFPIGAKSDDPLAMYLSDALTVPQNLAGLSAISIPCGFVDDLPVGLQLTAPPFQEERFFAAGHAYQQVTDWHTQAPTLP